MPRSRKQPNVGTESEIAVSDPYGPSRKLSAMDDPKLQEFGEALIDRVTALLGNFQLNIKDSSVEAIERLRSEYDARQRNDLIVLDYLKRSDTKLDTAIQEAHAAHVGVEEANGRLGKLELSHEALTTQVSALGGVVANIGEEVDDLRDRVHGVEDRVGGLEHKVEALSVEMSEVKRAVSEIKAQQQAAQQFLEAFPPIAEIQRLMDADRQT